MFTSEMRDDLTKYIIKASRPREKIFTNKERTDSITFDDPCWIIFNETGISVTNKFFESVESALKYFIQRIGTKEGVREITIQTEKAKNESE